MLQNLLFNLWYKKSFSFYLSYIFLYPLSLIYRLLTHIAYKQSKVITLKNKAIVIGNITVGGTGKTPLAIELAKILQARGEQVVILAKNMAIKSEPMEVLGDSDVDLVGDEALVLKKLSGAKIYVGNNKADLISYVDQLHTDHLLIIDDAMHYKFSGKFKSICMLSREYSIGNGYYLPLGPIRNPYKLLLNSDYVMYKSYERVGVDLFTVSLKGFRNIDTNETVDNLDLQVNLVTALADNASVFNMVRQRAEIKKHFQYSDHSKFKKIDPNLPILCTYKDLYKLLKVRSEQQEIWVIEITTKLNKEFEKNLLQSLECKLN